MGWLSSQLDTQRGHLFPWIAIAMAIGIGAYFSLRFEPGMSVLATVSLAGLACAGLGYRLRHTIGPLGVFAAVICLGFLLAAQRAHQVAGPVLERHYYGAIEGRVVGLDRSASDAVRVTLDEVVLANVPPARTPLRVRISLHGDTEQGISPQPGMRIMTTGHLSPLGGPVEPGGFDFQRHSWFLGLGGVGYTRVPVVAAQAPKGRALWVFRTRMAISDHVRDQLPGDVGGFAAAVATGDRSGMSRASLDALRAANTAHLLAISGLHIGLLCAFVFAVLRGGIALIPFVALRYPVRKLAAIGALIAASIYLAMSGGNVSTERAFIMAAVALIAVMLDRRALSLRGVALAALIVLALRPEALLGPGFQMSFAATTALVAVFQCLRGVDLSFGLPVVGGAVGVLLSSAVAGLATAPIGAAHFNAIAHYGLLANLLSVPLMGAIVIPAAVLAAVLTPLGLEAIGLWLMGLGLQGILFISHWVAGLEGARSFVVGPTPPVLPLLSLGILIVILWQGRARWLGIIPAIAAFGLWHVVERPAVLVAENGALVGIMTDEGRALSKARGSGFVATNWLENDGERIPQPQAAARWPDGPARALDTEFLHLSGKRAISDFSGCRAGLVVVANVDFDGAGCLTFDPARLRETGAIAFYVREGRLVMRSVRDVTGTRHWSQWPEDRMRPGPSFAQADQ